MNIYFDCEFTDLKKDAELISIGFVTDGDDSLYAEITDYDHFKLTDFDIENVIPNLSIRNEDELKTFAHHTIRATKEEVADFILDWLSNYEDDEIEFVADVSHYDFVLLIDLLWCNSRYMQTNCSPACHDINQDIADYFDINNKAAFNMNREELIKLFYAKVPEWHEHNAISDAMTAKLLYRAIKMRQNGRDRIN